MDTVQVLASAAQNEILQAAAMIIQGILLFIGAMIARKR